MAEALRAALVAETERFIREDAVNRYDAIDGAFFEDILVGFAAADDPLFFDLKRLVNPEHMTPGETFESVFGAGSFSGGAVVSIALPISEKLRATNRGKREWASDVFGLYRSLGADPVPEGLTAHLADWLTERGYRAVVPPKTEGFKVRFADGDFFSTWSERHVAYAAGLGTFSLNQALITRRGIAVRLCSVVTDAILPPSVRAYAAHDEYCLFLSHGVCGACIKKCPAGALSKDGHDKLKCRAYCYGDESKRRAAALGGVYDAGLGCGMCQLDVPCETRIPTHK
jgi:epoxyqueuosine reductase QueG